MTKNILVGPTEDEIIYKYKDLPSDLLMISCQNNFLEGVKYVINMGFDMSYYISLRNHYDEFYNDFITEYSLDGKTAYLICFHMGDGNIYLKTAVERGNYDIVKYLLENGINPKSRNDIIIKIAKHHKYYNIVELLEEYNKKD